MLFADLPYIREIVDVLLSFLLNAKLAHLYGIVYLRTTIMAANRTSTDRELMYACCPPDA